MIDYKDFFGQIKEFKQIQNQQKARGLNDFNLLTTVLKYHDEVRLHSRTIGALLNSHGLHYQGTLFLKLFLEQIELIDFFDNLELVTVSVEYKDIDLYLTDGDKYLLIENKIWADDQPCQIIKYVNIIVEENKEDFNTPEENDILDKDKIRILYLTPRAKDVPSCNKVEDNYISYKYGEEELKKCSRKMQQKGTISFELNNYKVWYKKINYKVDILNWLTLSKYEIRNIANLNESISQYLTVIAKVNKEYNGNVMTLEQYVLDIKDDEEQKRMYEFMKEASSTLTKYTLEKLWKELEEIFPENARETIIINEKEIKKFSKDSLKKWLNETGAKNSYRDIGFKCKLNNNDYIFVLGVKNGACGQEKTFLWKKDIIKNIRERNVFDLISSIKMKIQ